MRIIEPTAFGHDIMTFITLTTQPDRYPKIYSLAEKTNEILDCIIFTSKQENNGIDINTYFPQRGRLKFPFKIRTMLIQKTITFGNFSEHKKTLQKTTY